MTTFQITFLMLISSSIWRQWNNLKIWISPCPSFLHFCNLQCHLVMRFFLFYCAFAFEKQCNPSCKKTPFLLNEKWGCTVGYTTCFWACMFYNVQYIICILYVFFTTCHCSNSKLDQQIQVAMSGSKPLRRSGLKNLVQQILIFSTLDICYKDHH